MNYEILLIIANLCKVAANDGLTTIIKFQDRCQKEYIECIDKITPSTINNYLALKYCILNKK